LFWGWKHWQSVNQDSKLPVSVDLALLLSEAMTTAGISPVLITQQEVKPDGSIILGVRIPRYFDINQWKNKISSTAFKAGSTETFVNEDQDGSMQIVLAARAGAQVILNARKSKNPLLSIILDDWGYQASILEPMEKFPARLTIAVLPDLPYSRQSSKRARAAGHEVILHCPFEPKGSHRLEEGTIMVGMAPEQVERIMEKQVLSVPDLTGINSHEGSKATEDLELMLQVSSWLKTKGLFFVDSLTTPASKVTKASRKTGIPYASRRIFLDNDDYDDAIEVAAREAVRIARVTGTCIAIGHARERTLRVLAELVPEIKSQQVELVFVSELLRFKENN
jgi:polysaccharide deacetylase 2 family uncharacterized protein YibQ